MGGGGGGTQHLSLTRYLTVGEGGHSTSKSDTIIFYCPDCYTYNMALLNTFHGDMHCNRDDY